MVTLAFEDPRLDRAAVLDKYDLLLGVVATLRLSVDGHEIYREVQFPIVELRVALSRWLGLPTEGRQDFEFESMESEEPGLLWVRRQDSGAWRVGSIHQDEIAVREFDLREVSRAATVFTADVDEWVSSHLGVAVGDFIGA